MSTASTPSTAATPATVTLINLSFQPAAITVARGTQVTWVNRDTTQHTVVGQGFESDILNSGQTFAFTFQQPGTYPYICTIHPEMKGTVVVQ